MAGFLLLESQTDLVPRLLELCPGFRRARGRRLALWRRPGPQGIYGDLGHFAEYLVECYAGGGVEKFPVVFGFVEHNLERADPLVGEQLVWGLIEDLQRLARTRLDDPEALLSWLGPRTQAAWEEVELSWRRRPGLMAVLRAERRGGV